MAFRSTGYWKWMVSRIRGSAPHATSTSQKRYVYAGPAADFGYLDLVEEGSKKSSRADFAPVYVALGLIIFQLSLGLAAVKQQLLYAPNARIKKKLRKTIPEVVVPDKVVDDGQKLIEKSFYRNVAHVQQEFDSGIQYLHNPVWKDAYAYPYPYPLKAQTLKSVGIDPQQL